jgi:hypothetical protein
VTSAVILIITWGEPVVFFYALSVLAAGAFAILFLTEPNLAWIHTRIQRLMSNRAWVSMLLLGVLAVGVFLRWRDLGFQDLWADENTSLDAIRGIIRTGGAPETTSGIWYTRSPFFHYALAIWLEFFGDTVIAARGFSALLGSFLLVIAFLFTKQLTRDIGTSLIVTAFLAVDQWLIAAAKLIRFYVLIEFLTLVCLYFFYKGYVDRERKVYQYLFFIPLILAILSQEVMITLVPIFLLGFLMFYKPFRLRNDWPLGLLLGLTTIIFFVDLVIFDFKCLTPPIALGTTTDSIAKPHLRHVAAFVTSFFAGASYLRVVLTFFFFLGFVQSIAARDARRLFLYVFVLLYLAELTVLVRQIALRYAGPAHPIFLILAIAGAIDVGRALASRLCKWTETPRLLRTMTSMVIIGMLVLGDEYSRVLRRSDERLVCGTTEVTRYIREHANASDVVISTSSPAAAVELGGLDYYVANHKLHFDVPYRDGNIVRDRWGGGVLISNPEAFSRAFDAANRVWIYTDEHTESRLTPAMRSILRTTGRPVMESYAATLRLWDRNRDPFPIVPQEGRALGVY